MGSIPFGIVKWLELIWKSDLPPNAKYISAYLRTFMNDKSDMAWPSYARMEKETGLSRSTLAKYLGILEESNWLIRERGNSENNTRYYANLPQRVSDEIIKNVAGGSSRDELGGSSPHALRSSRDELGVVRETDTNKQYNKQINKQDALLGEIIDLYESKIRKTCKAKGVFKESFLKNPSRVKNLVARVRENPEHSKIEFWDSYFSKCSQVKWIRDGIDGEAVCTLDMLVTKNKFDKNVEAFWA